jgi:hypothetical protein
MINTTTDKAQRLAVMFRRSLKMHNPDNGTHATLETFATFADLPFRVSPLILSKAKQFLQTLKP